MGENIPPEPSAHEEAGAAPAAVAASTAPGASTTSPAADGGGRALAATAPRAATPGTASGDLCTTRPDPVGGRSGTGRLGPGLLTAVVAAIVAAALYGGVVGITRHDYGIVALAVGYLVGITTGRTGGRHKVLVAAVAVLSLVSVYAGELVGLAVLVGKDAGVSATSVLLQHFGTLQSVWRHEMDLQRYTFYALAAVTSITGYLRATQQRVAAVPAAWRK